MEAKKAFDDVCLLIADKYEKDGWKYTKTSHALSLKDKNFNYKIFFYTSWNNISNVDVTFFCECAIIPVKSKYKIFSFTTQQAKIPEGKLYWNIANYSEWEKVSFEASSWITNTFLPIVNKCQKNLDNYVKEVANEGFLPEKGYCIDIDFILTYGSKQLAEEAAKIYYDTLSLEEQDMFKKNYISMINGGEATTAYGVNMMRNYSNFKTIIQNNITIEW